MKVLIFFPVSANDYFISLSLFCEIKDNEGFVDLTNQNLLILIESWVKVSSVLMINIEMLRARLINNITYEHN